MGEPQTQFRKLHKSTENGNMFIQAHMVEKDKQIDNSIKFKRLAKAPVFNKVTKNADFALLRNCVFPSAEGAYINSRSVYYSAFQKKQNHFSINIYIY